MLKQTFERHEAKVATIQSALSERAWLVADGDLDQYDQLRKVLKTFARDIAYVEELELSFHERFELAEGAVAEAELNYNAVIELGKSATRDLAIA